MHLSCFFLINSPCPVLDHGSGPRPGPGPKLVPVLGPGLSSGPVIFLVPALVPVNIFGPVTQCIVIINYTNIQKQKYTFML